MQIGDGVQLDVQKRIFDFTGRPEEARRMTQKTSANERW
jgi:hypothetical protein